uniref:Potassium/proton antiporter CemA n=1 Tax=Chlamydomonas nivalis TaxID=47906 RepID=A0A0S2IBG5_9CHLO|nr:chloroplast enveloppe membrane protein [Chlamydomonas nivalis]
MFPFQASRSLPILSLPACYTCYCSARPKHRKSLPATNFSYTNTFGGKDGVAAYFSYTNPILPSLYINKKGWEDAKHTPKVCYAGKGAGGPSFASKFASKFIEYTYQKSASHKKERGLFACKASIHRLLLKVYANKQQAFAYPTYLKDKQVVSITYEEIGLFPRSFSRVFDRFIKQLFSDVENLVIQEYRFYRYLFLTTVKCFFILLFVPFLINVASKNYLIRPLTEYCWNQKQGEIFLNQDKQKHAFAELQEFEEKVYFESLVSFPPKVDGGKGPLPKTEIGKTDNGKQILQEKTIQLAIDYNNASIEAISCMFADLISLSVFGWLLIFMEVQISVSRLFILEVFFGLDDTKKSLIILLVTDLLVGYHSVGPWSILFESLFNRYGLPNSQAAIYLLTGSLPVIMDVFFKYLIFRHLNRASPASVATYHAMIE